jgi:hypothetical protein
VAEPADFFSGRCARLSGHIPAKEVKILCLMSGNVCAYPGCDRRLVEPGTEADDPAVLGEMAHIVGEKRRGPRGADKMPPSERNRHTNLVLLCGDHHKVVDSQPNTYSVPVLRQMKSDHEARIAAGNGRRAPGRPSRALPGVDSGARETIHSTLLPVTHLPAAVFAAPCAIPESRFEEVRDLIVYPPRREELVPFTLREGKLFAFQDLRREDGPFARAVDPSDAEVLRATDLWENPEGRRRYVNLMNRSLFKYAARFGVRYDRTHRRFYFPAQEGGQERTVRYKSLAGRRTRRQVAWRPKRKKTGEGRDFWWHLAAGLKFHQFSERQWCLSIRPERHLTEDGETPLPPVRIGRRVTRLKARMYNDLYLNEVNFWREYLSGGLPRFYLDFGEQSAVVEARLLTVYVRWPGIPGDEKPFENQRYEEDLFTLADLEEATAGEEVDWEVLEEVEEFDE